MNFIFLFAPLHVSKHLRKPRRQVDAYRCHIVKCYTWRVTMVLEKATWSILVVESSWGLWPRTVKSRSPLYRLRPLTLLFARCLFLPPGLGRLLAHRYPPADGQSKWKTKQASERCCDQSCIKCFVVVEVGQKTTASTSTDVSHARDAARKKCDIFFQRVLWSR